MAGLSGDGRKLIGNDGTFFGLVQGTEVVGDGVTAIPQPSTGRTLIVITGVAAVTAWPGTTGATGAEQVGNGRILEVRNGDTAITPAIGDNYVPLTLNELCDISAWTLPFTADEIEITTFCDEEKKYRAGKDDVSGTASGIFTIGITDSVTNGAEFARKFMAIIQQQGGDNVDVFPKSKVPILASFVLNKEQAGETGDYMEYIAPVELFSFSLGAEQGANAQTFETTVRLTNLSSGSASVEILPGLYRRGRATP